jgi:hypothetical protein
MSMNDDSVNGLSKPSVQPLVELWWYPPLLILIFCSLLVLFNPLLWWPEPARHLYAKYFHRIGWEYVGLSYTKMPSFIALCSWICALIPAGIVVFFIHRRWSKARKHNNG